MKETSKQRAAGAYSGFFLGGAQNPIFPFLQIFYPIFAIFPRFNH